MNEYQNANLGALLVKSNLGNIPVDDIQGLGFVGWVIALCFCHHLVKELLVLFRKTFEAEKQNPFAASVHLKLS